MSLLASSSVSVTHSYGGEPVVRGKALPGHRYLLVVEGTHSCLSYLPEQGELTIGRSANADLPLLDRAASRLHARIRVSATDVECTDLGSHNGTRVNGERIHRTRTLVSGDVITICGVTLVFHCRHPVVSRREVGTMAQLRPRIAEELARGLSYRHSVSLVCLELTAEAAAQAACHLPEQLRIIDFVAWGSVPGQLWLLIPDRSQEELGKLLAQLLARFTGLWSGARIGYAVCPADGRDGDTLMAAARSAAAAAAVGTVLWAGAAAPTRRVGERDVIVADAAMVRIYALVEQIARSELAVLIYGETGSGKELIAKTLHARSPRCSQRFVALNCAALQDTMLESELFGHERGAFTGAVAAKQGLLELASGGTLFLDEVAELSLGAQNKLLRALEEKRILRVGGLQEREANIRIVAATHQDLEQAVLAGRFRKDLFYRLRHACVVLPPLRDRPRELPLLARAFLTESCRSQGRELLTISDDAMTRLLTATWPGNVRELRAAMEFAAATADGQVVHAWHLPDWVGDPQTAAAGNSESGPAVGHRFRPIADELHELEKTRMRQALEAANGVQLRAAELLRMPERTFYLKAKQYGLARREGLGSVSSVESVQPALATPRCDSLPQQPLGAG